MNDYGLEKIPDSVLLKLSRQEVGELKSEIDHLNYQKQVYREQLDKVLKENERLNSRKVESDKKLAVQLGNAQEKIKRLEKDYYDTATELAKLNREEGKRVKREKMYNVILQANAKLRKIIRGQFKVGTLKYEDLAEDFKQKINETGGQSIIIFHLFLFYCNFYNIFTYT